MKPLGTAKKGGSVAEGKGAVNDRTVQWVWLSHANPCAFRRLRWAAAAWLAVWVPAYASFWGPRNFLLLCDVAVILTCAGLWLGSPLLLSSRSM